MTPYISPEGRPLAIDLYCGLGGWAEGLLAEGFDVIGFDIEAHDYGTGGYPGRLVLQDVTTLHGALFTNAELIVASPPCQAYSYRAMPWSRAKALPPPDNTLFEACFRLQREACAAAGRYIPMVVENVRGAQRWVGRAAWNYGSYYLWGDVPALMPRTLKAYKSQGLNWSNRELHGQDFTRIAGSQAIKNNGGSWFAIAHNKSSGLANNPVSVPAGLKTTDHVNVRDGHSHTRHLTNQREHDHVKFASTGDAWFDGRPRDKMLGDKGPAAFGSRSLSRKAASALIAKIPLPLSQHIARVYRPRTTNHETQEAAA